MARCVLAIAFFATVVPAFAQNAPVASPNAVVPGELVIELAAAVLLLWGRTAWVGAGLIICVMLGAMGTHIVKDGGRHLTSEVVPITLATIVFVLRLRSARRLRGQTPNASSTHERA